MRINDYHESVPKKASKSLTYIWIVRSEKWDFEEEDIIFEITGAFFDPWKAVEYNKKFHDNEASIEMATAFTKLLRPRGE